MFKPVDFNNIASFAHYSFVEIPQMFWSQVCQIAQRIFLMVSFCSIFQFKANVKDGEVLEGKTAQVFNAIVKKEPSLFIYTPTRKVSSFSEVLEASNMFFEKYNVHFPTRNNRLKHFALTDELQKEVVEHANGTRPLIQERVLTLIENFLKFKRENGTEVEKQLYAEMTISQFVDRLLIKRPLMFSETNDTHLLKGGKSLAIGNFEQIGTDEEQEPYVLRDYMSYDEMAISALLSVSVPTHFINSGSRENKGKAQPEGSFERKGVYVGLVGGRFEKPGYMEYAHMLITKEQNSPQNGYGKDLQYSSDLLRIWEDFYETRFPTYEEAIQDDKNKYVDIGDGRLINIAVYKKRMRMTIESFLVDANERAKSAGKKAYVHAVGLGLGAWYIHSSQQKMQLDVYQEVMSELNLPYISDVNFSYLFGKNLQCGPYANGDVLKTDSNQIKIHFSNRNPADKLPKEDENKLLVASYAWDGNAYPGNEYWEGHLSASGDPAAACCSTIPELQNPDINPNLCGGNLFVIRNR